MLTTIQRRDGATLQERTLQAITSLGVPEKEIAAEVGASVSLLSLWKTESEKNHRQIRLLDLVALIRRWGADVVLAPLAAISGCMVVKVDGDAKACLDSLRRCMWPAMGHVERHLSPGSERGVELSAVEAAEGLAAVEAWAEEAIRVRDAYRAAAQGRVA